MLCFSVLLYQRMDYAEYKSHAQAHQDAYVEGSAVWSHGHTDSNTEECGKAPNECLIFHGLVYRIVMYHYTVISRQGFRILWEKDLLTFGIPYIGSMKPRLRNFLLAFFLLALSTPMHSQTNGKTILVEKITSVGCPGCPWGGYILDSLEQEDPDIVAVALHVHDQWHVDSLRCEDGDSVLADYLWGHPTAMIDRVKFSDQNRVSIMSALWKTKIAQRKLDPLDVTIGASSTYDPNSRNLSVTVNGDVLWGLMGDVRVNLYVVEGPVVGMGLGYDQLNGYNNVSGHPLQGLGDPIVGYQHKWVLRDMLGGPWGETGVIPSPAPTGSQFAHTFTTTLDPKWDDTKIYLVGLVQRYNADKFERPILNAVKLGLNEDVLANAEEAVEAAGEVAIYPQPMGMEAWVRIPNPEAEELRIYDLQGRLMRTEILGGGDIHRIAREDLVTGLYLVQLWGDGEMMGAKKLILR